MCWISPSRANRRSQTTQKKTLLVVEELHSRTPSDSLPEEARCVFNSDRLEKPIYFNRFA